MTANESVVPISIRPVFWRVLLFPLLNGIAGAVVAELLFRLSTGSWLRPLWLLAALVLGVTAVGLLVTWRSLALELDAQALRGPARWGRRCTSRPRRGRLAREPGPVFLGWFFGQRIVRARDSRGVIVIDRWQYPPSEVRDLEAELEVLAQVSVSVGPNKRIKLARRSVDGKGAARSQLIRGALAAPGREVHNDRYASSHCRHRPGSTSDPPSGILIVAVACLIAGYWLIRRSPLTGAWLYLPSGIALQGLLLLAWRSGRSRRTREGGPWIATLVVAGVVALLTVIDLFLFPGAVLVGRLTCASS